MLVKDKSRSIIRNATIFLIAFYVLGYSLPLVEIASINQCDCLEAWAKNNASKQLQCVKKYYDKAFDYVEARYPNDKFTSQEAVMSSYFYDKCKNSTAETPSSNKFSDAENAKAKEKTNEYLEEKFGITIK